LHSWTHFNATNLPKKLVRLWNTKKLFVIVKRTNFFELFVNNLAPDRPNCSQFHQHLDEQLLRPYSCAKKLQSQNVTREKLRKRLLYEKGDWKMLMKLTPGLNFINVLRTGFTLADPESVKRYL
jgi:hypothetical protein